MTNELTEHQHFISTVHTLAEPSLFPFYLSLLIFSSFETHTMWLKASIEARRMCVNKCSTHKSRLPLYLSRVPRGCNHEVPLYRNVLSVTAAIKGN